MANEKNKTDCCQKVAYSLKLIMGLGKEMPAQTPQSQELLNITLWGRDIAKPSKMQR